MKMKKWGFFLFISLLITQGGFPQGLTPEEWGLKAFKIAHETLGDVHYYVTEKGIDREKPWADVFQKIKEWIQSHSH
jgi:hypothetical protein